MSTHNLSTIAMQALDAEKPGQAKGLRSFSVLMFGLAGLSLLYQVTLFAVGDGAQIGFVRLVSEHFCMLLALGALFVKAPSLDRPSRLLAGGAVYMLILMLAAGHSPSVPDFGAAAEIRPRWGSFMVVLFPILVPAPQSYHRLMAGLSLIVAPVVMGGEALIGMHEFDDAARSVLLDSVPVAMAAIVAVAIASWQHSLAEEIRESFRSLGSYTLFHKLGEGGMGEVWEAEHRHLARKAAVKLIRAAKLVGEEVTPERRRVAFARFEKEAQVTAKLNSPHTVQLYDYGVGDDDTIYYAMELLEGADLETLVDTYGPMPQERVHFLLLQICDSLGEAHKQGLVHRDIKPANVFIARQGLHFDFVKVLDFGLVIQRENYETGDRLTMEGKITGSPMTMSPEQAYGDQVDGRADIYALGVVAYFALTGEWVFDADTARGVLMKHVKEEPSPISDFIEIDEAFEAVILLCLQKKPEERPRDIGQLYKLLQLCEFPRPWSEHRARRWYRDLGLFADSLETFAPKQPSPTLSTGN